MILQRLLLVDGVGRTGKFFLGNLLSSLQDVEHVQHFLIYDLIPALVALGKMSWETGVARRVIRLWKRDLKNKFFS